MTSDEMESYHGWIRTPNDAILLFEACRIGLLPRVQRRLSEKERRAIRPGSVFVWDEQEAGMRRWTDGKSWSASRVSGSFLTYREMLGKREVQNMESDRQGGKEIDLADDGFHYKSDGLIKQSFSITTSENQHLHLISYVSRNPTHMSDLKQPSQDPRFRHIRPDRGRYPESTVQEPQTIPAVTRGPLMSSAPRPALHRSPSSTYHHSMPQYGPYFDHSHHYPGPRHVPHYTAPSMSGYDPPGGTSYAPQSHYAHYPYPPNHNPPPHAHPGYPPPPYQAYERPGVAVEKQEISSPRSYSPRRSPLITLPLARPNSSPRPSLPSLKSDSPSQTTPALYPPPPRTLPLPLRQEQSATQKSQQNIPSISAMLNDKHLPRLSGISPVLQDIPCHKLNSTRDVDVHDLRRLDRTALK